MTENKRFVVAIHALVAIAILDDEPVSSERLAWSADMNAAAIRRMLGRLGDAGLVESTAGPSGGYSLGRAPEAITLLDVYRATGLELPFRADQNDPNDECPIGTNIRGALGAVFDPIEAALYGALEDVTLADVAADVRNRIEAEHGVPLPRRPDAGSGTSTDGE